MVDERERKEKEILSQYTMGEQEAQSVKAWAQIYSMDDILGTYLEKSGYPFKEHLEKKEKQILSQYTMTLNEEKSVRAWTNFYETDDLVDFYLDKSGYTVDS